MASSLSLIVKVEVVCGRCGARLDAHDLEVALQQHLAGEPKSVHLILREATQEATNEP